MNAPSTQMNLYFIQTRIAIGNLTEEQKNVLFDQFFSKEAKMTRLQRIRQRKQALEQQQNYTFRDF
ncbi:MAG: hypothetical protein SAK29_21710 [Scytonema sp. PMC 1069.18]|nr:hypothetical protein [Scytonema sp. PMC 1069.18]MEC4881659.1 hypothetical protein [Scytonema sp. PMC 1070.18]